ncbi:MAG: nicotinamidase [Labilithrix sp.]|nr:nicotinamidase [Labilithrix sp.]MCW5816450.1 nicotinamidase [Labilithrix sp.]
MLPAPLFHDAAKVPTVHVERASLVAEIAEEYRKKHKVPSAAQDKVRIAAFGIDAQIGFCTPGASLFVPGAVEDTQRTIDWLYKNLDKITQLAFSLDTHRVFQIFHPAWWIDDDGKHPGPFTPIATKDVKDGRWKPVMHPAECLEYVKKLEASGKYTLTIWPYHTLLGGVSHALVPALMEAAMFHSLVRNSQTHFETKGTHAMTENYSVMSPEVRELGGQSVGTFNAAFFKLLMDFDRVYVFGQAKSHCVLSTLRDMQEHIAKVDPKLMSKIWVLEDATSPVPAPALDPLPPALDFPKIADAAFAELRAAGMNLVKTTDPIQL